MGDHTGMPGGGPFVPLGDIRPLAGIGFVIEVLEGLQGRAVVVVHVLCQPAPLRM